MLLCTLEDLNDYLLPAYLEACEGQNPGIARRTVAAVSGEIRDMLASKYPQPWPHVPPLIRYIAAVMSAYRTAEGITSLVSSEGSTDNEWLPLQSEWKRATGMLEKLAKGELKLPFEEVNPDKEEPSVAVVAPPPLFDFKGF